MSSEPATVPASFPEILKDLNREVLHAQPTDVYQFCANYFFKRLEDQRSKFINLGLSSGNADQVTYATVLTSIAQTDVKVATTSHGTSTDASSSEGIPQMVLTSDTGSNTHVNGADNSRDAIAEADENESLPASSPPSSDDEEEDDDVVAAPPPPTAYNRGRRTSVSAESMAPAASDVDYVKVVIPKTDEQRSRIQASIKNNFLFRSCDEEQYADVVNAMSEKKVAPGETVIQQGGIGDYFYVVETGTLDVFVSRNGGAPVKVTDYGPGGSFGELALMYNAPRAATVTATAECVLWALDRVTFRRILMENTSRKRRMYERFLEEVELLQSLEAYERHKIADALESLVYNDGDRVISQGDVGDNFYIIEAGEATILTKDSEGVERVVGGYKKGAYFGELALLNNEPRKATIVAKGRLKVATLGKKAFVRLLGPVVDIIKRNANNYASLTDVMTGT
ncbi:hypothetical protein HK101_001391, partial [Irineochytrium annulatum]